VKTIYWNKNYDKEIQMVYKCIDDKMNVIRNNNGGAPQLRIT
jgi:hypothetical protein